MINATFTSNINEYSATIKKLILESGKQASVIVQQEARLFVRDCLSLTPPRKRRALKQSFNEQRRQGEAAVRSDIGRVFQPLEETKIIREDSRFGFWVRKYIREGNFGAVEKMLSDIGYNTRVVMEANEALHQELRNPKTGRLLKGKHVAVMRINSIKRLLAEKIKHVGRAKSGWMKAAAGLGVKGIPAWIRRHSQPGLFENRLTNLRSPSVTVGNLVGFIQEAGRELGIMEQAISTRTFALKKRIELMMNALHRKYQAK